jgi:hypothetical protein
MRPPASARPARASAAGIGADGGAGGRDRARRSPDLVGFPLILQGDAAPSRSPPPPSRFERAVADRDLNQSAATGNVDRERLVVDRRCTGASATSAGADGLASGRRTQRLAKQAPRPVGASPAPAGAGVSAWRRTATVTAATSGIGSPVPHEADGPWLPVGGTGSGPGRDGGGPPGRPVARRGSPAGRATPAGGQREEAHGISRPNDPMPGR